MGEYDAAWYEFSAPEAVVLYGWGSFREAARYAYLLNIGKVGARAYTFTRLSQSAAHAVPLYGEDAREDGFMLGEALTEYYLKWHETVEGWSL